MAKASDPPEVKLICGMLSSRREWLGEAVEELARALGAIDLVGEIMDFDFTDYYDDEMGRPLLRQFASFAGRTRADALAKAKVRTNAIEADFARRHAASGIRRPVNLDVGYIEPSKLVLASMKNFAQRIYLGGGVYAEVTLLHRGGRWEPLAWTFPDYASGRYDAFLTAVRDRLCRQLRGGADRC